MSLVELLLILSQLYGNVYFQFGSDLKLDTYSQKYFTLGYVESLNGLFHYQFELGGWSTRTEKERSSLYTSYQVGLRTQTPVYLQAFTGVAAISAPDSRLSSVFQFKTDLGIGVIDKRNVGIGVNYSHVSNAGIKLPNLGRNYIQLRVEIPFN